MVPLLQLLYYTSILFYYSVLPATLLKKTALCSALLQCLTVMCSTYYMSILTCWFHTFKLILCSAILYCVVLYLYYTVVPCILHCGVALYCIVSFCILLCCGAFRVSHTILELACFALQYCTYCFIMYSTTARDRPCSMAE